MVEKFKEILATIEKERGSITLFAIMKMDEYADKWSVIISASWINLENRNEVFGYITAIFNRILTSDESSNIARIGLFAKEDHVSELFLKFSTGTVINEQKINGFTIHEAIILKSDRSV